jgi:hypothetical protein
MCKAQAAAHGEYCVDMDKFMTTPDDPMWYAKCIRDALVELKECMTLAEGAEKPH